MSGNDPQRQLRLALAHLVRNNPGLTGKELTALIQDAGIEIGGICDQVCYRQLERLRKQRVIERRVAMDMGSHVNYRYFPKR